MTFRSLNRDLLTNFRTPNLKQFRRDYQKIRSSRIFRIEREDLCEFFDPVQHSKPPNQGECRNTLNMLKECQYNQGLCRLLGTDPKTGIIGDKADIERRRAAFGGHTIALPRIQSFRTILYRQFEDANVIYMTWVATVYLCFSLFGSSAKSKRAGEGTSATEGARGSQGHIEALTIYFGLMFASLLAALCDYIKEKQHLKIKDQVNDQMVTVFRGAFGTATSIPIRDLVVGDIVRV